jgi:hypothetical protein
VLITPLALAEAWFFEIAELVRMAGVVRFSAARVVVLPSPRGGETTSVAISVEKSDLASAAVFACSNTVYPKTMLFAILDFLAGLTVTRSAFLEVTEEGPATATGPGASPTDNTFRSCFPPVTRQTRLEFAVATTASLAVVTFRGVSFQIERSFV